MQLTTKRHPLLLGLVAVFALLAGARPSLAGPNPAEQGSADQPAAHDRSHHHQHTRASKNVEVGEPKHIPDVLLLDQDGQEVRFYSDLISGRVVAVNFIFTTCTTVCLPMGAIFTKVQRELGDRVGRDVDLISVSVDPVTDTPERLKAWSQRLGAGTGWTLVTGSKPEVDNLLKSLEVFTPDFADHSPTVLIVNARVGSWKRAYGLAPAAKLSQLIEEMIALDGNGGQSPP